MKAKLKTYHEKFLKDEALSSLLLNHSKDIITEDHTKRFSNIEAFCAIFLCFAMNISMTLISNPLFNGVSFIDRYLLLVFPSSLAVVFLISITSSLYKKIQYKKYKAILDFNKLSFFSFFYIKPLMDFDKKYNFEKIKKALDSHDFQSPDLTPYINDFFDFTQDDLKELDNDEIKLLFEKTKPYPKMANKVLKSIKKKKPIRKINARYFLEKTLKTKKDNNEIDISSLNLEDYLSNELNGILLDKSKKYMDII